MADDPIIDIISPRDIGADKIVINVADVSKPSLGTNPITLEFDYSAVGTGGLVLPLEFILQPSTGRGPGHFTKIFRKQQPSSFTFTVPGAGEYLAVLRECGHNFWQGRLLFEVGGEEFSQILSTR